MLPGGIAEQLRLILHPDEQGRVADRLAKSFEEDRGFPAQHFAVDTFSAATTGICLYVLRRTLGSSYLPQLPEYFSRCIRPDGTLDPDLQASGITTSNWSRSQLLMALTTWSDEEARRLAERLAAAVIDSQHNDGGFSVREHRDEGPNPLVTHYAVLGLVKFHARSWGDSARVMQSLAAAAAYLADIFNNSGEHSARRLLAGSGLNILGRLDVQIPPQEDTVRRLGRRLSSPDGFKELVGLDVMSTRHPLWFTRVWRPAFALPSISLFSPLAHCTRTLAVDLARNYMPEDRAWVQDIDGPTESGQPFTWATALGLLTARSLTAALTRGRTRVEEWVDESTALASEVGFWDFDVAVTFAGPDRPLALRLVRALERSGVRVFYDDNFKAQLLGADLSEYLQRTYYQRARFTVPLLSRAFLASRWALWEWRAVLARMVVDRGPYVLPFYLEPPDLVRVPGLNPSIGYLMLKNMTPEEFAEVVVEKILDRR